MTYSASNFLLPTTATVANTSGSAIAQATPVKITSSGMNLIDISSSTDIEAMIGLTLTAIANGANGPIIASGLIPNIGSIYVGFAAGDGVWISSSGTSLTNVPPTSGSNGFVSGMFVIKVGVVQPNLNTPSQLDLLVLIQNRGQL
jgi:hypothetical protein